MPDPTETAPVKQTDGWMSDVQRALALILVGSFAVITMITTVRTILFVDASDVADMAKTLQAAMVNMGLVALGFFFGNTMAKMAQDAGQQKVVDKLTSTNPAGAPGPIAPVAPAPLTADAMADAMLTNGQKTYYAKLTDDDEKKKFVGMSEQERLAYMAANPKT